MALLIVGLLLCVVGAGCSFALDGPPADYEPRRHGPPVCHRDGGAVAVLDGLAIGIAKFPPAIVSAVLINGDGLGDHQDPSDKWIVGAALGGLGLAALGTTALARGRCATAQCEKAHLDYQRWKATQARRPALPVMPRASP